MNKLLTLLSALFLLCTSVESSYLPISSIEMDSDFMVIGNIEKIETKTAILSCSHLMRNLSRQPEKREANKFQIILTSDDIKIGNHGIWILYSQNRTNSIFSAKKLPTDYPNYQKIGELIRSKDYLYQNSPWIGIWRTEDNSTELYLGESRTGYIKENGNVIHCLWSADIDRDILSVYKMTEEGSYRKYDFYEKLDPETLFCRSKDTRLRKISDNKLRDDQ